MFKFCKKVADPCYLNNYRYYVSGLLVYGDTLSKYNISEQNWGFHSREQQLHAIRIRYSSIQNRRNNENKLLLHLQQLRTSNPCGNIKKRHIELCAKHHQTRFSHDWNKLIVFPTEHRAPKVIQCRTYRVSWGPIAQQCDSNRPLRKTHCRNEISKWGHYYITTSRIWYLN